MSRKQNNRFGYNSALNGKGQLPLLTHRSGYFVYPVFWELRLAFEAFLKRSFLTILEYQTTIDQLYPLRTIIRPLSLSFSS
jgi:hypothetical protein